MLNAKTIFVLHPLCLAMAFIASKRPSIAIRSKYPSTFFGQTPGRNIWCVTPKSSARNTSEFMVAVESSFDDSSPSTQPTSKSKKKNATPRSVAVAALLELSTSAKKKRKLRNIFAVQRLESNPDFLSFPEQRDKSFARNLVATTERRMGQIDKVLAECASVYPPKRGKHAALLQSCLRVGAAQLLFLSTPHFAAVKETVDVLKDPRYRVP